MDSLDGKEWEVEGSVVPACAAASGSRRDGGESKADKARGGKTGSEN